MSLLYSSDANLRMHPLTSGWQLLRVDDFRSKLKTGRLLNTSPHHRECTPVTTVNKWLMSWVVMT